MKPIFKNEHNELRAGWQIALFIVIFSVATGVAALPLITMDMKTAFLLSIASLIGVTLATFIATRFVNRKPFSAVGLAINSSTLREFGIGCLLGWLMMTGIFGAEYLLGYVKVVAVESTILEGAQRFLYSLVFFAVAAMFEEMLFRGYMFQTLARGIRFVPAALIISLLFGLAHLGNPNPTVLGFVNTALIALIFSFAYGRTRALWLPFGIHLVWNFSQTTLYGFATSGLHFSEFEQTKLVQFGPEWITGGAYGPEAGALATIMIGTCALYIYYSHSLNSYPGVATLEREGESLGLGFFERGGPGH